MLPKPFSGHADRFQP